MLNEEQNKMMDAAKPDDGVTFKAASGVTYDFFFPGSGKWKAMSVRAQTREEAQQYWEANRVLVNPEPVEEAKPVAEEKEPKVGESKVTNNE